VFAARDSTVTEDGSDSTLIVVSIVAAALVISCCFFAAGVAGCVALQRARASRTVAHAGHARHASRRGSVAVARSSYSRPNKM
jgi:hypothetical protein